jgi:CheY-like chemotaxis protein
MAKILVIDDEETVRDFTSSYLRKRGLEVVVAMSGKEGLETYPREKPDLILLDLGLTDIDGRAILKDIKTKMPALKVMVTTAYKDESIQKELLDLGADYFITKPLPIQKLFEAVQEALKQ